MMLRTTLAASAVALASASAAMALPAEVTNLRVDIFQQSDTGNFDGSADATWANAFGATKLGTVFYTGALNFRTSDTANDATTVQQWLESGGGTYSVSSADTSGFESLTISNPNINGQNPTALTTWFIFTGTGTSDSVDLTFSHDDGMQFCEGTVNASKTCEGTLLVDAPNPTSEVEKGPVTFDGGDWSIAYAATNGDPSVLTTDATGRLTPVPLPAAAWMLIAASGGLIAAKRRQARKAA